MGVAPATGHIGLLTARLDSERFTSHYDYTATWMGYHVAHYLAQQRDADSKTSSQITQDAALWFNVIDAECSKSHIITGLQVTEHQTETRRGLVGGGMCVACNGLDAYGADHGPQQFAPLARRAVVMALVRAVSCYEVASGRTVWAMKRQIRVILEHAA
ncbi:unnamed protein product [Rhizoctonia solani]|uniref:Uncharacterized protein n=1 Tax=Rhizoctonia solani TaxID=456999 RepID=A0A8H2W8L5_9AGAM|nr:unnamed protein product [Rhizoctonia solani]